MRKLSKVLTSINIISIVLSFILQINKYSIIYTEYISNYFKGITIFVGLTSIVLAVIAFKDKNTTIGTLNVFIILFTILISLFRKVNYMILCIPLLISVVNLILLMKHPDSEKIDWRGIVAIIICTSIELIIIAIPIMYGYTSISNFEKALPEIQKLNAYKGRKNTDMEGFTITINNKRIRLEYEHSNNETMFTDTNGNELFRIKSLSKYGNHVNFINYIIASEKYGID